jgi:hypothetical protein
MRDQDQERDGISMIVSVTMTKIRTSDRVRDHERKFEIKFAGIKSAAIKSDIRCRCRCRYGCGCRYKVEF